MTVVTRAGEPETWIWCTGCFTAARVRIRLVALSDDGVTDCGYVEQCLTCDRHEDY